MINQKNKYVTCGQMKLLERRADENGLSYYQMMENAGSGAAAVIREKMSESGRGRDVRYTGFVSGYPDSDLPAVAETAAAPSAETGPMSALIFCGKGNNGGDGFVIARLLCAAGYDVTVIMVDGRPRTEDAVTNYELLLDMDVRILDMTENERALLESGGTPDLIADAMYGTGFFRKSERQRPQGCSIHRKDKEAQNAAASFRCGHTFRRRRRHDQGGTAGSELCQS